MTARLADISSYQHGLRIGDLTDCIGILAKCSEGDYFGDADYNGWRLQTPPTGKAFIAYDFVRADETADAQAAWIASHIVDRSLPLMLDVESEPGSAPTFGQVLALVHACLARGLRPKLVYLPRWYWQQIGSPDMSALNGLRIGLISSAYPNIAITGAAADYAADGGDSGPGWAPYGGVQPIMWQYSDRIGEGGYLIDMNAWRGTADQLRAFLGDTAEDGDLMASYTMSDGWTTRVYPDIAPVINREIPLGTSVPVEQAALSADVRGIAAAEYARQARDHGASSDSKLDQVLAALATLKTATATPIDLNALAALIAEHQTAGSAPDVVAAAVLHHLSAATANG